MIAFLFAGLFAPHFARMMKLRCPERWKEMVRLSFSSWLFLLWMVVDLFATSTGYELMRSVVSLVGDHIQGHPDDLRF